MKFHRSDRPTVLYVEDHPVNVLLMEAVFHQRPGFRLAVATTGKEALRMAAEHQPALLLLDLNLPDCHGTQLLQQLRRQPGCRTAPAVAVTADSAFQRAGTGFVDMWAKPLDLQQIFERLDRLMAGSTSSASPAGGGFAIPGGELVRKLPQVQVAAGY